MLMKKFLVLYNAPPEVMEEWAKSLPEDQKKGMDEWVAWGEEHKNAIVDFGNPAGKNKRVTKDGATDTRNEVGGYSILQAESHEEATKIVATNPHLKTDGAYTEVMEIVEM